MKKQVVENKEEGQVMIQLLNIANKAGWLEVAEPCLHFMKKIQELFKEEEVEGEEVKEKKSK